MRIEDESVLDKILRCFGAQKFFWRIYAHSLLTRATGVERLDVKAQKIFLNQKPQRNMWATSSSSTHVWSKAIGVANVGRHVQIRFIL